MDVIFRHKNKDDVIMAFKVEENILWGDNTFFDKDSVYLDMLNNDIETMINALNELRNESVIRDKFDIEMYIDALNDILGVDHAYFSGDEKVDALVELIVTAKNLVEENEKLKRQLEPFKEKQCFTCLHLGVGDDHMPCYACRDYDKYEWLGGKQQ